MRLPHTATPQLFTWRQRLRHGGLNNASLYGVLLFLRLLAICSIEAAPHPTTMAANNANDDGEDFRRNDAIEYGAPLITPLTDSVTLDLYTNYIIRCEANESLVWKVAYNDAQYEEETFDTGDPQRPFGSMLHLRDVTHNNVGNYFCIKKSSVNSTFVDMLDEELVELVNSNKASSIYVYVNDTKNLLVVTELPTIIAYQYQHTVIPCKPTMPDLEVLLTTPHGEDNGGAKVLCSSKSIPQLTSFPPDNVYDSIGFDSKVGFTIHNVQNITDLVCFSGNETTNSTHEFYVRKIPINEPSVEFLVATNIATAVIAPNYNPKQTMASKTKRIPRHKPRRSTKSETSTVINNIAFVTNRIFDVTKPKQTHNTHKLPTNFDASGMDVGVGVGIDVKRLNSGDGNVIGDNKNVFDVGADNKNKNNKAAVLVGVTNGVGYGTVHATPFAHYKKANIVTADSYSHSDSDSDSASDERVSLEYTNTRRTATSAATRTSTTKPTTKPRTKRSRTKYIKRPVITSTSRGHVNVSQNFTLNCFEEIALDVAYTTDWKTPEGVEEDRVIKSSTKFINSTSTHGMGLAMLTILNAQKSDSGLYECICTDSSGNVGRTKYQMSVLNINESYINISESEGYYKIESPANKMVQINVGYRGYPFPSLTWHKPDKTEIHPSTKYMINTEDASSTLQILNAQLEDSGEYTIRAKNDFIVKELQFNVSIADKPKVTVDDVYVQAGMEAHLRCRVISHPTAMVTWAFTPCSTSPRWPSCDHRFQQNFNSTSNAQPGDLAVEYIHDLYFTPEKPGIIHCMATNLKGRSEGKGHVLIGDISDNMTIFGIDENRKIARGDEVTFNCAALSYYFSDDLDWYKNGELVEADKNFEITNSTSSYSFQRTLKINDIQDRDQGDYECRARYANNYDQQESKYISIDVYEPLAPKMVHSNFDDATKLERKLGESLELECTPDAIPAANVHWYKDDMELNNSSNVEIEKDGSKLIIHYIKPEDEGVYKCVAVNRLASVESSAHVQITNLPRMRIGWILGLLFFFIVLIALVIYLCVRVMRERKRLRDYKAAGLANFEEGAVEHINRALTLDEQADLLPYNRAFEFPREKLKLGKQLGAGAFGVVLKAHAEGIRDDEKETVVAVKMVKRIADNEVMRALVTELKIMVHLGPNLNVVNLLGAVTKNIAKRELMVIVEYCRYGNVQNFLLRNRKRFINQINPETDKIDPSIIKQRFSDNFELNRDGVKYVNLPLSNHQYVNHMNNVNNNYTANNRRNSENDPRSGTRAGRPNSAGYLSHSDLYEGNVDSCATEQTVMTSIPEDEDQVLSNNSVQPAWRSNYKPDSTEAMTITTTDLVSWAFQVARGMDYLSSRKVLHGDLAARNILLCENNVVKICDFGLARSMYKSENYKKQGEARLPIKWLALESFSDHVFNTYTDVWSFGIVLWEFFSLAKVPYPGMDPDVSLYAKLKDGYRMEKPPFANDELYDIMLECWSTNPESRPLFKVLEKYFARILGDDVTNHYVDLNDTYLRANNDNADRNPTDYLSLMGSPDEIAPMAPRYVNGHILPEIRIQPSSSDDCLTMSIETGTTIFSPTRPKDHDHSSDEPNTTTTSFTFPDKIAPTPTPPSSQHSPTFVNNLDSPVNKNRKKDAMQPEEIPMLPGGTNQNSDGDYESPEQGRKFGKNILQQQLRAAPIPTPRHHIAETELTNGDNYVNFKTPKKVYNNNGARTAEAFSNPGYQIIKTVSKDVDAK